jgi:hypothetical protein
MTCLYYNATGKHLTSELIQEAAEPIEFTGPEAITNDPLRHHSCNRKP